MIVGEPPVAIEKPTHDTIAIPAMPDERPAWLEHARPFRDDACVIAGVQEKSERREQVDHRIEARCPPCRQLSHVAARVAKRAPRAALARAIQQLAREIEAVDVEPRLREQVCVTSLSARDVEHALAGRKPKQVDESSNFAAIASKIEDGLVLEQIVRVEVLSPPVVFYGRPNATAQKNTGSRYAPNTVSMAARIS